MVKQHTPGTDSKQEEKKITKIVWYCIALIALIALLFAFIQGTLSPEYIKDRADTLTTPDRGQDTLAGTTTDKLLTTATSSFYAMEYYTPAENDAATDVFTENANLWLAESGIKDVTSPKQAEEMGVTADGCTKYEYAGDYTKHKAEWYVSFVNVVYSYTCGAHGNIYYVIYNEDVQKHSRISKLSDIYQDSIYAYLSEISRSKLPAQIKNEKGADIQDIVKMFEDGTSPDPENYSTFYFDDTDVVIVFGQYAIGPYAMGITELRIPLSSLAVYKR